jgi:hypothetical protein
MADKDAKARIKINKLLEESGWRFFDLPTGQAGDKLGKATIKLDSSIKLADLGDDFHNSKNGFIDFLTVDENQNLSVINSAFVKELFNSRIDSIGVSNLHLKEIKKVEIPLPPLEVQQRIVAEMEGYQKIIDGARL